MDMHKNIKDFIDWIIESEKKIYDEWITESIVSNPFWHNLFIEYNWNYEKVKSWFYSLIKSK